MTLAHGAAGQPIDFSKQTRRFYYSLGDTEQRAPSAHYTRCANSDCNRAVTREKPEREIAR